MANAKISELPSATTPLAGTELAVVVQAGETRQVAVSEIGGGSAASYALTATVANNSFEHSETIAAVGVVAGQSVALSLAPHADSDENAVDMLDLVSMSGEAATDAVIVTMAFSAATAGAIKLQAQVI